MFRRHAHQPTKLYGRLGLSGALIAGALLCCSPARAEVGQGDNAPDFSLSPAQAETVSVPEDAPQELSQPAELPRQNTLKQITDHTPAAIWFPDAKISLTSAPLLVQTLTGAGLKVLIVPVVGDNQPEMQRALDQLAPLLSDDVQVLQDPNGFICLEYCDKFVPGVSPINNLYIIGRRNSVSWCGFWPGITDESLEKAIRTAEYTYKEGVYQPGSSSPHDLSTE